MFFIIISNASLYSSIVKLKFDLDRNNNESIVSIDNELLSLVQTISACENILSGSTEVRESE